MSSMQLTSTKIDECRKRYKRFCEYQLQRTRWAGDPTMFEDFTARERWLEARRDYLKREYEAAERRERKLPPR